MFRRNDVHLETELVISLLRIGNQGKCPVLKVILSMCVERYAQSECLTGKNWFGWKFCGGTGTSHLVIRNDQRGGSGICDHIIVINLRPFQGLRKLMKGPINAKFRRLAEAGGGTQCYNYDREI